MTKPKQPKPAKPTEPWEVLPIQAKGDDSADPLFLAVGRALTAWELMDAAQASLFSWLVNSRAGAAEAAYGMVASASGRCDMVLAAASEIFPPDAELLLEIEKTISDIRRAAGRRNDIAHGVVTKLSEEIKNAHSAFKLEGYFLASNGWNTRKQTSKWETSQRLVDDTYEPGMLLGRYAYVAMQVDWYAAHFRAYRDRLVDLGDKTRAHCAKKWPPQAQRIQQLEQQLRELQEKAQAPGPQPPSSQE